MLSGGFFTCLILPTLVKHAHLLSALLPEAEVLVASGEMKADVAKRAATWEDLRRETQPIVITTLADEGIDIPSLSAVIIAGAGASKVKALQRLRCMTSAPGKARALVLDFLDHGAHLRKHSLQRIASLKAAGLEVRTRRAEEIAGD
jgi:superfamily II DNA or RNA helicase